MDEPDDTAPDTLEAQAPAGFEAQARAGFESQPDTFDISLERAIARLPAAYRAQLASVAIVVADEATADELAELGVHGLYGLYRGIPRTILSADGMAVPNLITLYRGPLERDHRSEAALEAAVEDTLRHELAHHLGISDERLQELKGR